MQQMQAWWAEEASFKNIKDASRPQILNCIV